VRSRVVKGPVEEADPVDRLTLQGIHNEQQVRAVLSSGNDAATIDFIGRDATGELLFRAFRVTIEVYFTTTWSKAPDPQCEDFDKSVGIIKSRVIAECRELWRGRLFAPSDMNPPAAGKELPWFDRMPLADVRTALEDEANRWSKQAREFELGRRKEAESVSPALALEGNIEARDSATVQNDVSGEAVRVKKTRANTVGSLIEELNILKPQMLGDAKGYDSLKDHYCDYLCFKIAEDRSDLKLKIQAIGDSMRHIRLAQELAGAHHGRELSTIQQDWKHYKPDRFKRSHRS
jgi:hypothetical protein